MTLLAIANDVADRTKGPRPATIAGNSNPDAQNILSVINKAGIWMMKAYGWDILTKEHTFTSVAGETQNGTGDNLAVPEDWDRFIPETCWDRDSNNLISGPISPVEWAGLKVQNYSEQNKKFRYRAGQFITTPELGTGVTVAYEYIKKNWATGTGGEKDLMDDDSDAPILDQELITRAATLEWLDAEGQPTAKAMRDFKTYFDQLVDNEMSSGNVSVVADIFALNTRHFSGSPKPSRSYYGEYY